MTIAIAAVGQLAPSPSALLTVSGLTVGTDATLTVQRAWAGKLADVRSATDVPVTGDTVLATDWECPFVPASYQVTVRKADGSVSGQASSAAVSLDVSSPWISDPLSPGVACAITLQGDALAQLDYVRAGETGQPLGAVLPVAVVGTRMAAGNVPLDVVCYTIGAATQVRTVLTTADPVCLRTPDEDKYSMLDRLVYVSAPTVSEMPINLQFGGQATRFAWSAQIVRPPTTPIAAAVRTYPDLLDEAATYGDLAALYDDYNALLLGG